MIADATSHLTAAIQKSLMSGVNNCNNRFNLEVRTDAFRFLFDGKHRNLPRLFYDMNDFDKTFFKDNWYVPFDNLVWISPLD